jgi:hypothetical protein
MRKTAGLIILLSVGGVASNASAQLRGSDTLEGITKALLTNAACNGGGLTYLGGGSGTGEDAMRAGTQQIAPMSRPLNNNAAVCTTANGNASAEGMLFGLDGMVVVADSEQTERCGSTGKIHTPRGNTLVAPNASPITLTTPGLPAPVFSDMGADWNTKLRQIYWGLPAGTATSGGNCNSAERQALFNNYKSLFPNTCSGSSGQANTCGGIAHAFRRGDQSGTTDLFRTLLSAGTGATGAPFCNGNDQQDKDPLRRACTDTEQVCSPDGKLGFVLPILVPESDDINLDYPTATCPDGRFRYAVGPFDDSACCFRNPDGTCKLATLGLKCPQPVTTANGPCLNGWTQDEFDGNQLVGARFAFDARAYNLQVRRPGATGEILTYSNGVEVLSAYYRINSTRGGKFPYRNTTTVCREADSTKTIGCLVQAPNSGCSIGFAGGEAVQVTHAEPLALNGIDWTDANIQNLVSGGTPVYPLARKLYVNTIKGFQAVTAGAEKNLATCFATPSIINAQLDAFGFTRLPSQDPVCEEACPNGPAGAHCSNNPAPFN